jgi:hypothetical protein
MTERDMSIGQLVSQATADVQSLVKSQIELTKLEVSTSVKEAAAGSGLLVGAGTLAFLGFIFLLITAAEGMIAAGLSAWLSFLIVALVLIVVAAILGFVGKKRFEKVKGPERSIKALEATKSSLSHLTGE